MQQAQIKLPTFDDMMVLFHYSLQSTMFTSVSGREYIKDFDIRVKMSSEVF